MSKPPISEKVAGLRQRERADGTWRIWWEPRPEQRAAGFRAVELDEDRPTWSIKSAKAENRSWERHKAGDRTSTVRSSSRTVDALIERYRREVLPSKKPATQKSYHTNLLIISETWGDHLASSISVMDMFTWGRDMAIMRGATQAKRVMSMMSVLMKFAERPLEWRARGSNPCSDIDLPVPPPRRRIATAEEVAALEDAADKLAEEKDNATFLNVGHAIRFGLFQGARLTDILAANTGHFTDAVDGSDGFVWRYVQSKRGTEMMTPVHPENAGFVRDRLRAAESRTDPLIPGPTGRWRMSNFETYFSQVRTRAAKETASCATLTFRDLRRTAGVRARMGGADRSDVGDALGNSLAESARLAETYTPPTYHTAARAIGAIRRPKT